MVSIVSNQRSAFVSAAMSQARLLADQLANVSPAEAVAIAATTAAARGVALDMVYLYDDPQEARDIEAILDGHLARCQSVPHAWRISGEAHLSLVCLKKQGVPNE